MSVGAIYVTLYSLTDTALLAYRNGAQSGANGAEEIISRKLSAILHNSCHILTLPSHKQVYSFGEFKMIVNEELKQIEEVSWYREDTPISISASVSGELKKTFKHLGLSKSGNLFI